MYYYEDVVRNFEFDSRCNQKPLEGFISKILGWSRVLQCHDFCNVF